MLKVKASCGTAIAVFFIAVSSVTTAVATPLPEANTRGYFAETWIWDCGRPAMNTSMVCSQGVDQSVQFISGFAKNGSSWFQSL
jgi:hypothetical protein